MLIRRIIFALSIMLVSALGMPAHGQTLICFKSSAGTGCTPVSASAPLPVSASVSASISGFAPAATGTPFTATTGGATGTLPAGQVVAVFNVGSTNAAYCKLGASSTVGDIAIPPSSWFAFTVGAATQLTCITSTSTTTINMVGGSGLPTGAGGGGGGSGGGGAVTMASGAVASGAYSSGSIASGAFASGALAAGSVASGAMVDLGSQADSPCGTATGPCSLIALMKFNNTATTSPLAAGTAIIGNVRIDQTTPGTTNGTQDASSSATGSAVPAKAMFAGARSGANLVGLIQADTSAAINVSTATTTQLVALSGSTKIYVTSFDVIAAGTGNITFVYGTGSNCGTGTTSLTGAYNLTAQNGIAKGGGLGPVLVVPSGNALCVTTTAAVQMSGSVAYTQF